jgi:hypothetical protein
LSATGSIREGFTILFILTLIRTPCQFRYYDGPNPVDILDLNTVGNAKCEGELFSAWTGATDKKIPLDTKTRDLTCTPSADVNIASDADIPAGSITIATTAGPIYAQIPRRFSPTLEARVEKMESDMLTINTEIKQEDELLRKHVLGAAMIRSGKVVFTSNGAALDPASWRFTFPNPDNLNFIPIISSIGWEGRPAQTESRWLRDVNAQDSGPNFVTLWQGAQETSARNHPPINCDIAVISID